MDAYSNAPMAVSEAEGMPVSFANLVGVRMLSPTVEDDDAGFRARVAIF